MNTRVWILTISPKGSERVLRCQKDKLMAHAAQRGYHVVGVSKGTDSSKIDFYHRNGVSSEIYAAAMEGKMDALLLTSMSRIIPNTPSTYVWSPIKEFCEKLQRYGVQVLDLVRPDTPFEPTAIPLYFYSCRNKLSRLQAGECVKCFVCHTLYEQNDFASSDVRSWS